MIKIFILILFACIAQPSISQINAFKNKSPISGKITNKTLELTFAWDLDKVDNYSAKNMPLSDAAKSALLGKANKSEVQASMDLKANKSDMLAMANMVNKSSTDSINMAIADLYNKLSEVTRINQVLQDSLTSLKIQMSNYSQGVTLSDFSTFMANEAFADNFTFTAISSLSTAVDSLSKLIDGKQDTATGYTFIAGYRGKGTGDSISPLDYEIRPTEIKEADRLIMTDAKPWVIYAQPDGIAPGLYYQRPNKTWIRLLDDNSIIVPNGIKYQQKDGSIGIPDGAKPWTIKSQVIKK